MLCWFGAKFLWQLEYEYEEPFPQDGPVLLLCNHTSTLDPIWVAWGGWRPMHYMASQQLFRFKALGALIRSLGAFPKIKHTHDPKSNATLEGLYHDGRSIVLFPEGTRTWDGRLADLRPGLGRLVKRLDARVVIGRVTTGHLRRPRWAPHARRVPVHVRYSAPRTFPDDMSADEITAEITEAMRIDPGNVFAPEGSWGRRLAEGLPQFLWACPACFEL
ncbi:MAG: lysophospholipid acyltransferase family protein, partial [Myxococcota bacterium]